MERVWVCHTCMKIRRDGKDDAWVSLRGFDFCSVACRKRFLARWRKFWLVLLKYWRTRLQS